LFSFGFSIIALKSGLFIKNEDFNKKKGIYTKYIPFS